MFGVEDLRNTRFAQELIAEGEEIGELRGKIETKLQIIPPLLAKGFSVKEIAEVLQLELEQVREFINKMN